MQDLSGQNLGQYRIIEPIGKGGMASVFKAYQPALDRHVAIKVLPPYHAHEPGFTERFEREAKAVAQLNHHHWFPRGGLPVILRFRESGESGAL